MKILIPLLLLTLGVNANEVVYGSKSGTIEAAENEFVVEAKIIDVAAGEAIQILNVTGGEISGAEVDLEDSTFNIHVKYKDLPLMGWQEWQNKNVRRNYRNYNQYRPVTGDMMVGPCSIYISAFAQKIAWQVSYKLTKPSAAGTTTSAPILLPPTQDAAKSWFVKLQVSSDLKAWDDVAPGQFLGSDTARFFRIQTTEAE